MKNPDKTYNQYRVQTDKCKKSSYINLMYSERNGNSPKRSCSSRTFRYCYLVTS